MLNLPSCIPAISDTFMTVRIKAKQRQATLAVSQKESHVLYTRGWQENPPYLLKIRFGATKKSKCERFTDKDLIPVNKENLLFRFHPYIQNGAVQKSSVQKKMRFSISPIPDGLGHSKERSRTKPYTACQLKKSPKSLPACFATRKVMFGPEHR